MGRRVFLTGGSGLIGGALLRRLLARGDEVVALARSDAAATALRARGARVVRGDLLDEEALLAGMRGAELALNVAGVNTHCPRDAAELFRANAEGAEAVARVAARAGVGALVHTSSAATLGEPAGTVGSESSPHRGWFLSAYEASKLAGERRVLAVAGETGLAVVSVNPASVQGPGRSGGTGRFLVAALDGRLRFFVDTFISLVDVEDCVEGHLLAAARGRAGERYVLSGATLTTDEALALLGRVTGARREPFMLPRRVISAAAGAVELGARVAGRKPPFCRAMARTILHGHRYDGSRACRELGLRYTPVEETLRRTLRWAVAEGLVREPAAA
jgi:dihydroflavonol-4-reductase